MSWTKYANIKELLYPGSYANIKHWLKDEKASLSDKDLDAIAFDAILQSTDSKGILDYEKALQLFNIKLKQHISEQRE